MCLILFSLNNHPVYKLIIAANRDEFYARKTAPAGYWPDHPDILGGRDLEAQGTWMAMNLQGKIAMVTNYRDPLNINPNAPSRGKLVSDYLGDSLSAYDYLKLIEPLAKEYNGFNLLAGTIDELFYLSNYSKGIQKIKPGLHGISNHLLETPWPKVVLGKERFQRVLDQEKIDPQQLLTVLYYDHRADAGLPDTGISLEREKALSSMFIKTVDYGTRCSTAVLVDNQNNVQYVERDYAPGTYAFTTQTFEFVAPATLQRFFA
jgi:uncharacterized protein with NRDE domain